MKKLFPLAVLLSFLSCGVDLDETPDEPELTGGDDLSTDDDVAELGAACGLIKPGTLLKVGTVVPSCNGIYRLAMQGDGNLVLYAKNPERALWSTRTSGKPGATASMQTDGNLVVYRNGAALWASNTSGKTNATLSVQSDGNLVIRTGTAAVWNSQTRQCGALLSGQRLVAGAQVLSCGGKFKLAMQADANLVLYQVSPLKSVWSSKTSRTGGSAAFAVMQTDGNLVVYLGGKAIFDTHTSGHAGAKAAIRDDGTVTVNTSTGELWSSDSGGGGTPGLPVPASLVSRFGAKPYVEQSCVSTTYPGWPHAAKRCTYTTGGITTSVTVANPSPAVAAQWIVDSAELIPSLKALRTSSPSHYVQGLEVLADVVINASSRIFPLEGGIVENITGSYVDYYFLKGVTRSCSGCYCRLNSLTRGGYCNYRSGTGAESYGACQARVGGSGYTDGWGSQCLKNHADSFTRSFNDHFRARAWNVAQTMSCRAPGSCSPAQVVSAIRSAL